MTRFLMTLAAIGLAQAGTAQTPSRPPAGVSKNAADAPTGTFKLDPRHTSVIARVAHAGGTSFSTFRFGTTSGTLIWNGADPARSQLSVTIDMTSLQTPVPNFANELIGDKFLKTGQFPESKFVSTAIERTGENKGRITGNLTFMGQTRPITIDAQLVGIGRGGQVIGFSGTTRFKRSDFGFTALVGPIGDEVEILIDTEFGKA